MYADLVKIGNSQGVRIPAPFLKQLGIETGVDMEIREDGIFIKPAKKKKPREGWEENMLKVIAEHPEPDELVFPSDMDSQMLEEWNPNDN